MGRGLSDQQKTAIRRIGDELTSNRQLGRPRGAYCRSSIRTESGWASWARTMRRLAERGLIDRRGWMGTELTESGWTLYRELTGQVRSSAPTMPQRFQQRRARGWSKPAGGRCVSRPSKYGNPFAVAEGRHGDPAAHADVVARFRDWITAPEQADLLAEARRDLRGLDLGCYCTPGLPCHADVLLDLVNRE